MQNKRLIGIAGLARSGKGEVEKSLMKHLIPAHLSRIKFDDAPAFHRHIEFYAFADPLKLAASAMFGLPLDDFYGGDEREIVNGFWGISPRVMLQKLGTEGGRHLFGEDLWIKRAHQAFSNSQEGTRFFVTDIRFEDEADWIRSQGGDIIHVKRRNKSTEVQQHSSENGVSIDEKNDIVINNDGTLEDLDKAVQSVIRTLNLNDYDITDAVSR